MDDEIQATRPNQATQQITASKPVGRGQSTNPFQLVKPPIGFARGTIMLGLYFALILLCVFETSSDTPAVIQGAVLALVVVYCFWAAEWLRRAEP